MECIRIQYTTLSNSSQYKLNSLLGFNAQVKIQINVHLNVHLTVNLTSHLNVHTPVVNSSKPNDA